MRLKIRRATEGDIGFVFKTMLLSARHDQPFNWPVENAILFKTLDDVYRQLFLRPGVEVCVCCDSDDPGHIFGYLVYEPVDVVHFMYVKRGLRRNGVATALLAHKNLTWEDERCQYSHFTSWTMRKTKERKLKWKYNPYLLMKQNAK